MAFETEIEKQYLPKKEDSSLAAVQVLGYLSFSSAATIVHCLVSLVGMGGLGLGGSADRIQGLTHDKYTHQVQAVLPACRFLRSYFVTS